MKQNDKIDEIIDMLEDMRVMTGRMGRYEQDMIDLIILKLEELKFPTKTGLSQ